MNNNWIFGYGSLIWNPGFPYIDKQVGYIKNWTRRFYQGSTDHRGVPGSPGRVVTLLDDPESKCWGMAFQVTNESLNSVFSYLDHREKGGFSRYLIDFFTQEKKVQVSINKVHVYVADRDNSNYLGPDNIQNMAQQIHQSIGPSGPNTEYLLKLAEGLRTMGIEDDHVFDLENHVRLLGTSE